MDKFTVIFVIFISNEVTSGLENGLRVKRGAFDDFKTAALVGASEITGKLQEGVGYHDKSDREINFFGAKIGGGHNFKTGFGNAVKDSDEDDDRRRRRRDLNLERNSLEEYLASSDEFEEERVRRDVMFEDTETEIYRDPSNRQWEEREVEREVVFDNGRYKRSPDVIEASSESGETFVVVEAPEDYHRRKRSAMRSFSRLHPVSDSSSEETTPETDRKKRAADPCFTRRTTPRPGTVTIANEEFDEERQRKKRQAPEKGDKDQQFEQFLQQLQESMQKVAKIAKTVQEAFAEQAGTHNYPDQGFSHQ